MKKVLKLVGAVLLFAGVSLASCKRRTFETNRLTGLEGKTMPAFNLLLPDSSTFLNTADLEKGQPTVLFYFGADCPYCSEQIDEIRKHMNEM